MRARLVAAEALRRMDDRCRVRVGAHNAERFVAESVRIEHRLQEAGMGEPIPASRPSRSIATQGHGVVFRPHMCTAYGRKICLRTTPGVAGVFVGAPLVGVALTPVVGVSSGVGVRLANVGTGGTVGVTPGTVGSGGGMVGNGGGVGGVGRGVIVAVAPGIGVGKPPSAVLDQSGSTPLVIGPETSPPTAGTLYIAQRGGES